MLELILTLIIAYIAPYPVWLTLLHIGVRKKIRFPLLLGLYLSVGAAWPLIFYLAFTHQEFLFASRFKTNLFIQGLGLLILLGALVIEWQSAKVMGIKRLVCLPELWQKETTTDELVVAGIYKYARHPRYVEYPLIPLGCGLVFGYKFLVLFSVYLFVGYTVVSYFEEAELLQRYGRAYEEYQKKVPRFFIRWPF